MIKALKIAPIICFIVICSLSAFSQTISISGTVKDAQGQPIPLAFIRDAQHYYATYADSAGSFVIKADPSSILTAIAVNYNDINVKIDKNTHIDIVMIKGAPTAAGNSNSPATTMSSGNTLGFLTKQDLNVQGGSQGIKAGFNQEPTKGSPYQFNNWIHGFAVNKGDSLLYDINNLYNFDKLTGNLVFTRDNNSIMQVKKEQIKSFYLFNGKLQPLVFVNEPVINGKPFVEVLLTTPKYKIYKKIETRLERASFHTDGIIETGHKYDEYIDITKYYFVKLPGGQPQSISLKKGTLKKLLEGDADKFIAAQSSRDVDEDYLRDLNFSLNQ